MIGRVVRKLLRSYGYELKKAAASNVNTARANPYLTLTNWSYQEPVIADRIKPTDLVLDIGSGHAPASRANILADYFIDDNFHRAGDVVNDRPLIACSVERLPFQAKSIDYAICSHVVEHVESPIRAGKELARIAVAGYIETPAYGKDILVGTGNMHRWQIVEFEGTMHYFEYSERQTEAHITSPVMLLWMHKEHHPWQDFFWERQDLFNAMHLWNGEPHIVEHRRNQAVARELRPWRPVDSNSLPDIPCSLTDVEIQVLERCLATPDGSEPMVFAHDHFRSKQGDISYPVRGKRIYCEMSSGDD